MIGKSPLLLVMSTLFHKYGLTVNAKSRFVEQGFSCENHELWPACPGAVPHKRRRREPQRRMT
jgi:hypothetical protein